MSCSGKSGEVLPKSFSEKFRTTLGNRQQDARRSSWTPSSLFPILKRIHADANHMGKLGLTETKLATHILHILFLLNHKGTRRLDLSP